MEDYRVSVEIVLLKNNKVLLAKRSAQASVAPDCWSLPAGKVKFEEIPVEAVLREAKEEVGLDVEIMREVHCRALKIKKSGREAYRLIYTYLVKQKNEEQDICLNDEHSEYLWVDAVALKEQKFSSLLPDVKEILEKLLKIESNLV